MVPYEGFHRRDADATAPPRTQAGDAVTGIQVWVRTATSEPPIRWRRDDGDLIDTWLSDTYPEMKPLPPLGRPWQPYGRGSLLLPQSEGTDGMFCLRLTS